MTLVLSRTVHSVDPQSPPTVREVQNLLLAKGYPVGKNGADGHYGPDTELAVHRYQAHEGLHVDGIVGNETYGRLKNSQPTRTAAPHSEAAKFADLCFRLVTQGIDGTPPSYVFGAEVSMHDPSPDKIDCSELVQWGVTQVDGKTWVDGSKGQYDACHGHYISVDEAMHTKGAIMFATGNGLPSGIHHVVVSMGNGKTAEARSAHTSPQCGSWDAAGRFKFAARVPVLSY